VNDDLVLINQALDGDQAAFGELVERYQRMVYNLTYRMLGEAREAEDAAQEAFFRAYQNLARYDPERSFKTWLLAIASNHCIDRLRKRRLTWLSLDEPLPPHPALTSKAAPPEEAAILEESSEAMQGLLADLPPDYRVVIVLRYWYDMSYIEIAETLETTESAIKSRLFRARQALAEKLQANGAAKLSIALEGA
jgi:RNA polymerase sigma-70 factor (ECF subfamily)